MNIKPKKEGKRLIVKLDGRIDTNTAPALSEYFENELNHVEELELDLEGVDYVSSAGLRAILFAQKKMDAQGKMVVSHVSKEIMETFELTCFTDFLTII